MHDLLSELGADDRGEHFKQHPHPPLLMHDPQLLQPLPRDPIQHVVGFHEPTKFGAGLPFAQTDTSSAFIIAILFISIAIIASAVPSGEEYNFVFKAPNQFVFSGKASQYIG